jgi:predicted alternative tryptophan synthase beta-subunit
VASDLEKSPASPLFAETEGIVAAPESAHAIHAAIG